MPRLIRATPRYRRHATGQAVVTLDGRDHYLGRHGTKVSRQEYDRLLGEWLAGGRRLARTARQQGPCIDEIIAAFWDHAQTYYRRADGSPTSEVNNFREAIRPLRRLYGSTPANEFGPLAFQALAAEMIRMGWARTNINRQLRRVRLVFGWATSKELIPANVFYALKSVPGLKLGRTTAYETKPVKPVPQQHIDAVRPLVSRQVRAMIDLQLVTGMRPGEACAICGRDLDTNGVEQIGEQTLWVYRPMQHKTVHHGHERILYLGRRAQEIITPFLKPDLSAPLFSPADADAERRAELTARRKTPLSCGNTAHSNRRVAPKRKPSGQYTTSSYCRAIARACVEAGHRPCHDEQSRGTSAVIDKWHLHQLCHNFGTWARREYGLEAAQVLLGQRTITAAQIYAEKNIEAAKTIVRKTG